METVIPIMVANTLHLVHALYYVYIHQGCREYIHAGERTRPAGSAGMHTVTTAVERVYSLGPRDVLIVGIMRYDVITRYHVLGC